MNVKLGWGFAVAFVLATLLWNGAANDAREQRRRLEAALAARDSALTGWQRDRQELTDSMRELRADSAALERARARARILARDSIGQLLALITDSTARAAADSAVRLAIGETEACEAERLNCEARAANAEERAAGDSLHLAALRVFVTDTLTPAWRDAERRAQPSLWRDVWRSRRVVLPVAALTFGLGVLVAR